MAHLFLGSVGNLAFVWKKLQQPAQVTLPNSIYCLNREDIYDMLHSQNLHYKRTHLSHGIDESKQGTLVISLLKNLQFYRFGSGDYYATISKFLIHTISQLQVYEKNWEEMC